jgi:hypothetical protein
VLAQVPLCVWSELLKGWQKRVILERCCRCEAAGDKMWWCEGRERTLAFQGVGEDSLEKRTQEVSGGFTSASSHISIKYSIEYHQFVALP